MLNPIVEALVNAKESNEERGNMQEFDYGKAFDVLANCRDKAVAERDKAQDEADGARFREAAYSAARELLHMHRDTGINLTRSFVLERFVNLCLQSGSYWESVRDNDA